MKFLLPLMNLIFLTLSIYFGVDLLYRNVGLTVSASSSLLDGKRSGYPAQTGNLPSPMTSSSGIKTDHETNGTDHRNQKNDNKTAEMDRPLTYYAVIKTRNLFHTLDRNEIDGAKPPEPLTLSESEIANLEKTDLDVTLWGTVKGWDTENYAVIEEGKSRNQGLYQQGDTIEGTDAVIKKVLRMSVILTRNGKDQILDMAEEAKAGGQSMSPPSSHGKVASTGNSSDKIEMTLQRSLIDEAMGDINGLMKQARIRPHFTEGKADGLLVYGVKQRSIFKEMGIRNGDILMGIDGNKIQSVEDAISLYDKLKNASEAKIEVKRRGKTKEFLYHVE